MNFFYILRKEKKVEMCCCRQIQDIVSHLESGNFCKTRDLSKKIEKDYLKF